MSRRLTLALAVLTPLMLAACASHIHEPGDKVLAEQAQKQLQTVIKAEQERLAVMAANHQKLYAAETQAMRELDARAATAVSRRVLRLNWQTFRTELGTYEAPGTLVKALETMRDERLRAINTEFVEARRLQTEDARKFATAETTLTDARAQLTRWNRRVAALEKLIEVAPTATALRDVQDFDAFKSTTRSLLATAGAEPVTYVDALGVPKTITLKDELGELLDDARALRDGDAEAGAILAGLKEIVTPKAPGLVVTVAALAKDLAEAQRTRTLSRIASLERRLAVVASLEETITLAKELARAGTAAGNFPADGRVDAKLKELAAAGAAPVRDPLSDALEAVKAYVAIAGPMTARGRAAAREDAHLQHLQSLEDSANAIAQHQALLSRGLEGIAAYHAGGMKPEQVADLVHKALQLILLGVIAGGQ